MALNMPSAGALFLFYLVANSFRITEREFDRIDGRPSWEERLPLSSVCTGTTTGRALRNMREPHCRREGDT